MQRTAVNPWEWSTHVGYNQAELVQGASRQLICSGQTSVDAQGQVQHEDDMRAQIGLALDNLEAVLSEGGMGIGDVVKISVFATDVQEAMKNFDVLGARFGAAGNRPATTVLGVTGLAIPGLMFEIEATAMA